MIASFFQRLEQTATEYLLISGQATILYGAATFSEDIDLWIAPSEVNLSRFTEALRASGARFYKLTPPLTVENLARGYGFHFVVPDAPTDAFLDVMGRPPRVGSFGSALESARYFDTDFGRVRTVGIRELVELKKTQRPEDYPVIARLVIGSLAATTEPAASELGWAVENCLGLTELRRLLLEHARSITALLPRADEPLASAAREVIETGELSPGSEDALDAWLERRISEYRRADRRYWVTIIDELRQLRRAGSLMPEGAPV